MRADDIMVNLLINQESLDAAKDQLVALEARADALNRALLPKMETRRKQLGNLIECGYIMFRDDDDSDSAKNAYRVWETVKAWAVADDDG